MYVFDKRPHELSSREGFHFWGLKNGMNFFCKNKKRSQNLKKKIDRCSKMVFPSLSTDGAMDFIFGLELNERHDANLTKRNEMFDLKSTGFCVTAQS